MSQLRQFVKKRKQQRGKKKKEKEKDKSPPTTPAQALSYNPAQAAGTQSIEVCIALCDLHRSPPPMS